MITILLINDWSKRTWCQSSTCWFMRILRNDLTRLSHAESGKCNGVIHWNDSSGTISDDWLSHRGGRFLWERNNKMLGKTEAMSQFFSRAGRAVKCSSGTWTCGLTAILRLSSLTAFGPVVPIDEIYGRQTWKIDVRVWKPQKQRRSE